jgi:hypothetical protein
VSGNEAISPGKTILGVPSPLEMEKRMGLLRWISFARINIRVDTPMVFKFNDTMRQA